MRRSPKALERERRVEAFIVEANNAKGLTPDDKRLREVIEDPAYRSIVVPSSTIDESRIAGKLRRFSNSERGDGYGRIRRRHQARRAALFRRTLREIFTAIARAGASGPLQPDDIELPDPASWRRLSFNSDGTGRMEGGDYRERFEELYGLLDGLDLRRIRECSSTGCSRLFWARRSDQIACQTECANRLRVSRFYYKSKAQDATN